MVTETFNGTVAVTVKIAFRVTVTVTETLLREVARNVFVHRARSFQWQMEPYLKVRNSR